MAYVKKKNDKLEKPSSSLEKIIQRLSKAESQGKATSELKLNLPMVPSLHH